jgi:CRP-like cAMP-binding protein
MTADDLPTGARRFLEGVSSSDREQAASILARCPAVEIEGAAVGLGSELVAGRLLLVVEGFLISRATLEPGGRSIITCEAAPGDVLVAPSVEEAIFALETSRVVVIDADARGELLGIPALAERIVELLALSLAQKREAFATIALTRHGERVRRKLLQLGRRYGHVVPGGVRIDFPVSHALLAAMIGSSRETVTRAVDKLQRDGFVARRGSTYRLLVAPESVLEQPSELHT